MAAGCEASFEEVQPMRRSGRGERAKATEKKLAGAKTSFVKKCEPTPRPAACDAKAAEKKLAGAAKTSFTKKCARPSRHRPRGP